MLDEMKDVGESEHSGAVVKTESSYERLIVKNKAAFDLGVVGFSDSSSRKMFNSNKERKRSRVVLSDTESDELPDPPLPRKVHKFRITSDAYRSGLVGNKDLHTEKKVSNRLDDESDEVDEMRMRMDVNNDRLYRQNGDQKESGSGSGRMIVHRKMDLNLENNGAKGAKSSAYAMDDDELGLSVSIKNEEEEEDLEESIRLQGENGVLMENKHKQVGLSLRGNSQNLDGKKLTLSHNIHGQNEAKNKRKVIQSKSNASKSNKESKIKRPNFTEKQLLREKIKTMLLGAGWTIDYRPRRTRDYLDSVYISPSGTAYWSITKAYDALKKEEKEKEKENSVATKDFTPLPNEILNKLTRQTQKKLERELEKSRRHEDNIRKPKRVKKSTRFRAIDHNKEKLDSCLKEASEDSSSYSSDNSHKETTPQKDDVHVHVHSNSHNLQGIKSRIIGRRTLVVRGSEKGLDSENNDFIPYSGKRNLVSWLIDSGIVSIGEKVEYKNLRRTRVMQEGWITEDGIQCGCCSKLVTVLRFELHAGSKLGQPLKNIFTQSGRSLMECQIDSWNKQKESERKGFHVVDIHGDDPDDDTCGLCGDGGDLICCDGCPSTFHLSCLDMQMLPEGDWHCPNCACKYCSKDSGRTGSSLLTCRLCEKKYHKSCSGEMDMFCFCGRKCQELYTRLQKLLWMKHELDSGFSWSLIHRSDILPDMSSVYFYQRAECISKIAIALLVMDECFLPIVDRRSGINVIHNVVYNCGSNISRLNYSGFFTAVLERGDEMICAASIRIHGTQVAEMPFIGTRDIYRRQGMCRRLLHAIESALTSLKVEKLIIPAIEEHMDTWTNGFGFKPLEESCKQEMKSFNMMVFPGTDMLQKQLIKKRILETNITSKRDSIPSKNILRTKRPLSFFTGGVGKKGVEVEDYNKKHSGKKSELNNTSIRNHDSEPDSNVVKGGVQGGNKTGSKVEIIDLQNGNETAPGITDSNSNVICEPQLQVTKKDSVSTGTHSDSVVLRNGNVTDTPLESDLQYPGKESGSVSMAKENDAGNGNV